MTAPAVARPLVEVIPEVIPANRWVPISHIEAALRALGRDATREDVHTAAYLASRRGTIARRARTNRTYQFRKQPFTWWPDAAKDARA